VSTPDRRGFDATGVGVASAEEELDEPDDDVEVSAAGVEQAASPATSRPAVVSPSAVLVKLRMMYSFAVMECCLVCTWFGPTPGKVWFDFKRILSGVDDRPRRLGAGLVHGPRRLAWFARPRTRARTHERGKEGRGAAA
jgi:hypothetical protein